jgi:hypothetical protein
MPGLARKLVIYAAVDGLVLHPLNSRKDPNNNNHQQRSSTPAPVRIKYGDASISPAPRDSVSDLSTLPPNGSFEAFGIVGMAHPPPTLHKRR